MKILIVSIVTIWSCSIIQPGFCQGLTEKWQKRTDQMEMKWEKHKRQMGQTRQPLKEPVQVQIFNEEALEKIPSVQPGPFTPQTSLIINAAGFDILPLPAIKVVGTFDQKVYSAVPLDPRLLLRFGAAGWADSIETAKKFSRSGLNPMIAKVVRADNSKGLTLWIDDSGFSVKQQLKIKSFFQKCAVVVVH